MPPLAWISSFKMPALYGQHMPVPSLDHRDQFLPRMDSLDILLRSLATTVYPPFTSLDSSQSFFQAFCDKLASSLLLAYHIKMQHPLLILSRLFFAVMAERHWRSHL